MVNPKQNASAITLRSGKELESVAGKKCGHSLTSKTETEVVIAKQTDQPEKFALVKPKILESRPPFPERLAKSKKEKEEREILDTFQKVEVNIPLLDAIKQIPRYAKFLKELCTNKKKLTGYEKVSVGENVSVVLQNKLSPKFYPKGVLEDVLVQVNGLIFPTDFLVLDMEDDKSSNSSDILLGRPFLSTARTKNDVHDGTITMEFDGEVIKFNVYDAMKYPNDISYVSSIDVIEPFTQKTFELSKDDKLMVALCNNLNLDSIGKVARKFLIDGELQGVVYEIEVLKPKVSSSPSIDLFTSHTTLLPSIFAAP
ncbi:hypothetical protein P3X46_019944 [Hevea brasiliensis]|uniref:Uncharacterized protein n=1 Tax=Hevea brasiliensis TaxID=3981 RepID=A0ABQ9LKC5_HEVBR|nr:hypothetical protein P3X46_019944 [Hevea brasiliensis]